MTPAQEARALVERAKEWITPCAADEQPSPFDTVRLQWLRADMDALLSLAEFAARWQGATEAWIDWNEAQDVAFGTRGTIHGRRETALAESPEAAGPVRCVLIAPEGGGNG